MATTGTPPPRPTRPPGGPPSSVVGAAAVRGRGVGVTDPVAAAAGLDAHAALRAWAASPKSEARILFSGLLFLTQIPVDRVAGADHHPGYLVLAFAYFPAIGAGVGWVGAAAYDAAAAVLGGGVSTAAVAAAAATAATCGVTMCLHEDGLADAADATLGGWSRSEVLAIMKDSRVGTFGAVALVLATVAKVALLSALGTPGPSVWALGAGTGAGPALLTAHAMARATAPPLVATCDYIVDEEDAKGDFYAWFGRSRHLLSGARVAVSTASAGAIAVAAVGVRPAMAAAAATAAVTAAARWWGIRTLGGVAGDLLGGTICVAELAVYAALLAVGPAGGGWAAAAAPVARLVATLGGMAGLAAVSNALGGGIPPAAEVGVSGGEGESGGGGD
ncbi:hypothetical protein MMPV_001999 [Pyropia vietnamensis]